MPKEFICPTCGVTKFSRFALKRHQRKSHALEKKGRSVVVAEVPPPRDAIRRMDELRRNRCSIEDALKDLTQLCDENPGYLQRSSFQIAEELQRTQGTQRMCKEVYIGMVLAARAFSNTARPSKIELVDVGIRPEPVVTSKSSKEAPIELRQPPRRDSQQTADIRRVLLVGDGQPTGALERRPSKKDVDDEWKLDIWRSYGSKECRPPSPFGYKWAPAALFDAVAIPLDQLSTPKEPHVTWGPDSPMEALECDTVPEVPGWPLFSENGQELRRSSARWRRRYEAWRTERTTDLAPAPDRMSTGNRRVPSPPTTATAADVALPSPPKSGYGSLWKMRRELLRSASSPRTMDKERPRRRSARKDVSVAVPPVSSYQPDLPSPAAVAEPDIYIYDNEDNFDS